MEKEKNLIVENGMKRFQQIMEYTMGSRHRSVIEADDAPVDDQANGGAVPGGDPGAMGGDPGAMGGDPGAMGGDPGAMGGDPGAMGGDTGAMGGDTGAAQAPEGFNPQGGEDPSMDLGLDPNMTSDQMQPDDEVIDVDDLTDAQEDTQHEVEKIDGKFDKVLKALGAFEEIIRSNDEKIENLKAEFERRNPTQIEKLSMQTDKSYPFNVKPEDYWREKEATSNYRTEDDNNGKEQGQYVITKNDVDGATNWKAISDSLGEDDFMYNQTLNKILSM